MTQGINKQVGTLPAIKSKLHLFEVGREMLGANPVPRSHDATLEKRESGFDRIGVNVSHDVHARTVVNLFVVGPLSLPHGGIIRGSVVGEDYFHILGDVLSDVLSERSTLGVVGMEESEIAVALTDADYHFLVVILCDMALAAIHTADVGNIHLDFAIQHRLISLSHSVTDAMAKVPCRFVAHSDCALNLAGRHSLLRLAEQVSGQEPLAEREMRIVEHRAGRDGELIVTVFAVEELFVSVQLDHGAFAAQALRAFGEAETDKQFAALIFSAKQSVYIN